MDPITAVGLVTNVVTLVEISWKIVSKSREIYKNGSVPEYREINVVTEDLTDVNNKLLTFIHQTEKLQGLDGDDEALRQLCISSNSIANQLILRLSTVTATGDHRAWKSFRQALKSVWIKSELEETAARLQTYRIQLNTRLLVSVVQKIENVDQNTKDISTKLDESRHLLNARQDIQTQYLTRYIASQHDQTRELIANLKDTNLSPSMPGTLLDNGSSPLPQPQDLRTAIFHAVHKGSRSDVRNILRIDPSMIFAFNSSGQTPLHIAAQMGNGNLVEYLIRNGARINPDDNNEQLPLHCGVSSGSLKVVRALVANGADISAKDDQGRRPIDLCENSSVIHWILTHGSNLEKLNDTGVTALNHFVQQCDYKVVKELLAEGADIETSDKAGATPLFHATSQGQVEIMRLLISGGANVRARDRRKCTPLHWAAWRGKTNMIKLLLDHGIEIDAVNQHNFTALHECCHHGHIDVALILVNHGANCEMIEDYGYAPIHLAAQRGYLTLIEAMLKKGWDFNLMNGHRWTALAEACKHGHVNVVGVLLAKGAEINTLTGGDHMTALGRTIERRHLEIMKLLLKSGADPNIPDIHTYAILHRAAQQGLLDITNVLLDDKKTDINIVHRDGWTPLHEASWHGHIGVVRALLDRGARKDILNANGDSALALAAVQNRTQIVSLLAQ